MEWEAAELMRARDEAFQTGFNDALEGKQKNPKYGNRAYVNEYENGYSAGLTKIEK